MLRVGGLFTGHTTRKQADPGEGAPRPLLSPTAEQTSGFMVPPRLDIVWEEIRLLLGKDNTCSPGQKNQNKYPLLDYTLHGT